MKFNTKMPTINNKNSRFKYLLCLSNLLVINLSFSLDFVLAEVMRKDLQSHPNWGLLYAGDECGQSSSDRIIGGAKAQLGQYPWMARLGYSISPNKNDIKLPIFSCGGSVINSRFIMTAAHCCPPHLEGLPENVSAFLVLVRLGEYYTRTDPDCMNGVCSPPVQDIAVQKSIVHPDYANRQNDICLVKLEQSIQFSHFVHQICMPVHEWFQNNQFKHHVMEVAGWGVTNIKHKQYSHTLMSLKMAVVSNFECVLAFKGRANITERHLCAGGSIGKDSCAGDSGGPLMTALSMDSPPRYYQVGIVSFGEEDCATKKIPGVYTRVSEYLPWILDNIDT